MSLASQRREVTTDSKGFEELVTEQDLPGPTELLGNEWDRFFAECEGQSRSNRSAVQTVARPERPGRVDAFQEPVPPAA